jgi:hypothetical protein
MAMFRQLRTKALSFRIADELVCFQITRATFAFREARSAELLSDAPKDFVGESRISHGASHYYATERCGCPEDGFFPILTPSGEHVLKSLLERDFDFRRRASRLWS